jgi:hypothetical protein
MITRVWKAEMHFVIRRPVPKVGFEFGTSFVKGDSVPKGLDGSIGGGKRQSFWNYSDRVYCVPISRNRVSLAKGESTVQLTKPL